ncbi:MAG: hypothetical protein Q8N26_09080 [Myxococcales bacterium]|nr:hypothetical protein [Myxococcales bacterium]
MSVRAWLCMAVLGLGCETSLPALPEGAQVFCASDAECPTGLVCRLSVNRCRPPSADQVPPRVTESTITPTLGTTGTVFTATFSVDEALGRPPTVYAEVRGTRVGLELDVARSNAPAFVFSTLPVDGSLEGAADVFVDLVDLEGNPAVGQRLGRFAIDVTPPSLISAFSEKPAFRAGERVRYRVRASEALKQPPIITLSGSAAAFTVVEATESTFTLEGPPALAEGRYDVTLTLEDLAGLVATPRGAPFSVDSTRPVISSLEVVRTGSQTVATSFSRAAGFSAWTVRFTVDDASADVALRLDAEAQPPCVCAAGQCACNGQVSTTDTEGGHTLFVTATDAAGNAATGAVPVRFDFTAPRLVPAASRLTLRPPPGCGLSAVDALAPGATAALEVTLDEPAGAVLEVTPSVLIVQPVATSPSAVSFQATVSPSATDGLVDVAVRAADEAGNSAVLPAWQVRVVVTPPAAPDVMSASGITYRRAPWGTQQQGPAFSVRGAPGALPPGTSVEVLAGLASLAIAGGVDGGFVATLPPVDRPVVSVRALDTACNPSPAVEVKNVEWLASLRGKVAGRTFENPHRVEAREAFAPRPEQPDWATEVTLASPVTVTGRPEWRFRGDPPERTQAGAAFDTARGVMVVFGGSPNTSSTPLGDTWERDSRTGTWTDRSRDAARGPVPTARFLHAMAYDPVSSRVLLFGGFSTAESDELWAWDGAAGRWFNLSPTPRPAAWPRARRGHAMVFDPTRNRVVMFAGSGGGRELWEWDGATSTWTNRTPSPLPTAWPPALTGHELVADTTRGVLMSFGGSTNDSLSGRSDQLWEFHGATGTWVDRTPFPRPTLWPLRRWDHGLAYDATRARLVLFGGLLLGTSSSYSDSDLWEWDAATSTWVDRTPAVLPPEWPRFRTSPSVVFDDARQRLVVFGGFSAGQRINDTFEWVGATNTWIPFSEPQPALVPSRRTGTASTMDTRRNRLMLFGGDVTVSGTRIFSHELWEWNGASNRWLEKSQASAVRPAPRPSASLAYDAVRERVVLFGGTTSTASVPVDGGARVDGGLGPTNDLWEWAPDAGWQERTVPGGPSARTLATMTFDPSRGAVVLFGGSLGGTLGSSRELWEWNGATGTWLDRTPAVIPAAWPEGRGDATLVAVPTRQTLVLIGGSPVRDDVWEWNGATGTWVDRTPLPRPLAWPTGRSQHGAAWDPTRERITIFGGNTASSPGTDEVWDWNPLSGAFVSRTPSPPPGAWAIGRARPAFEFDAARRTFVAFGGFVPGATTQPYEAPWEYDGRSGAWPGVSAAFTFSASGAESTAVVTRLSATAVAGGSSEGQPDGVELWVSSGTALVSEVRAAPAVSAPGPVSFDTSAASRLATAFAGPERRVVIAVTPDRGGQTMGRLGTARLEWVEVVVGYRRP